MWQAVGRHPQQVGSRRDIVRLRNCPRNLRGYVCAPSLNLVVTDWRAVQAACLQERRHLRRQVHSTTKHHCVKGLEACRDRARDDLLAIRQAGALQYFMDFHRGLLEYSEEHYRKTTERDEVDLSENPESRASEEPFYLLHHAVHEQQGDSRLKIWLLAFEPVFEGDRTAALLSRVLDEHSSQAYSIYELLGTHDIMVSAWLPRQQEAEDLEDALIQAFSRHQLRVSELELNHVRRILWHWAWCAPGSIEMERPASSALSLAQDVSFVARLNATIGGNPGLGGLDSHELQQAVQGNLIGPYIDHEVPAERLRFAMFIRSGRMRIDHRRQFSALLQERIAQLAAHTDQVEGRPASELVLYDTPRGQSGEFLITGSLRSSYFYAGLRNLLDFVLRDDYRTSFRIRPVTRVMARPNFTLQVERLVAPASGSEEEADDVQITELLAREESSTFECKATVYVDINRWLFGDEELSRNDNLFVEGVARTVAAFLNTPGPRAHLLVGALERGPIERVLRGSRRSEHATHVLETLPREGEFWLTGIEMDIEVLSRNGKVMDADAVGRHVTERLESIITGVSLAGRLNLRFEHLRDRTLMLITVAPSAPKAWAYCRVAGSDDSIFPVRVGARSRSLTRSEEGEYRDQFR